MSINLTSNKVFLIGFIFRVLICLFFLVIPFEHANYGKLNPFVFQYFADLNFYFKFFNILDVDSQYYDNFINVYKNFIYFRYEDFYSSINSSITNYRFPGPFFPTILFLTFYSENFTILLALIVFLTELFTLWLWVNYLKEKINIFYLLFFVLMPFPLILGFLHSTDVFFYFFSTLIFLIMKRNITVKNYVFFILLFLILTIRPASLSIIFAVFIYVIIFDNKNLKYIFISLFCLLLGVFYYQSYFFVEREIVSEITPVVNLVSQLDFNSKLLEKIFYYITKIFFLFGFHPSSSGSEFVYLLRSFCGLTLLIGYIYSLKKMKNFDFFYLNLTILPIIFFLYPAWRYIMPISPLLYLYFVNFIHLFFKKK